MSLSRFITSRAFLIQLILAVILLICITFITLKGLEIYTRHGQSSPVPNFEGMLPDEALLTAKKHNLRIQIVDSLYIDNKAAGVVVDQIPRPGHGVKQNRIIFLTKNSTQPEIITLPRLTNISFRQARVIIENSGLQIGNISYRPSEFNNLVLEIQIDSVNIFPGHQLTKGSYIDLIVGSKQNGQSTLLPSLTGLTIKEAQGVISDAMLNTGVIIYDNSVLSAEDSLNACVWKQRPDPGTNSEILLGSSIDLWTTVDSLKLQKDTLDLKIQE